jgi:cytochrome c-type biogenesis protein CcmF
MNIGQFSIFVAFIAALGSTIAFYREGTNQRVRKAKSILPSASRLYWAMTAFGLLASVILLYDLLGHQFQYSYVARYSSRSLPFAYLISAFWAGQEGTFLLWAVLVSVMGVVFLRRAREDVFAMSVVSAYSAFLYLLLIIKSPFEMLLPVPADGAGLNPLLQDPWMAIHPPILFVGYAATAFPFAMVISALVRRNYSRWLESGFAWTLFSSLTLGAGIIIGGFWAYEVLGWGGYWGWDPVENSSLVPWLVLLALTHGLLVQKSKNAFGRLNIFLAIITFILVLYATFLTRSGVLADFSVHSFVDLGINNYLVASMLVSAVIGFGLFATRFREIRSNPIETSTLNREVALLLTIVVLLSAALFTFVGMSSPIITGFLGKASQVDTPFYDKVNLPVAIAMALLLGITPFLGWAQEQKSGIMKRLSMSLIITGLGVAITFVAGVDSLTLMVLVASAIFGLVSNVIIAFRQYRSGWSTLGGPVAHIGATLLLIGIVGSGSFDDSTQLMLQPNIPQSAFGFEFTFKGVKQSPNKDEMLVEVSDGRTTRLATPKLYFSEYNRSMMREPDITILPLRDLYLSPLELRSGAEHHHPMLQLAKGETKELEGYTVTFIRFDVGQHGDMGLQGVGAVLDVRYRDKSHEVVPYLSINEKGERDFRPADLPAPQNPTKGVARPYVTLNGLNVEAKAVVLEFHGFDDHGQIAATEALLLEVSTKPLMMVVWTGVVLIMGGTLLALRRRLAENGKKST